MKLRSWLERAKSRIPSLDAELIAVFALGFNDRADIALHFDDDFDFSKADLLLEKRASGVPLAYIFNKKEFFGREFFVNKNVLIPRPETEQIVVSVLDIVKRENMGHPKILDIGCGSGCIPISIFKELSNLGISADVSAVDLSDLALEVAKKNAERLDADVTFYKSDLLEEVLELPDILTANLPYVDRNWSWTSAELKFEPDLALYAEDGGLFLIKKLIDEMVEKRDNTSKKYAIFEADSSQHDKIVEYTSERGFKLLSKDDFILTFRY